MPNRSLSSSASRPFPVTHPPNPVECYKAEWEEWEETNAPGMVPQWGRVPLRINTPASRPWRDIVRFLQLPGQWPAAPSLRCPPADQPTAPTLTSLLSCPSPIPCLPISPPPSPFLTVPLLSLSHSLSLSPAFLLPFPSFLESYPQETTIPKSLSQSFPQDNTTKALTITSLFHFSHGNAPNTGAFSIQSLE